MIQTRSDRCSPRRLRRAVVRNGWILGICLATACGDAPFPPGNSNCPDPTMTEPTEPATISYTNDVRPILLQHGCVTSGCHGGIVQSSGFNLTTRESAFLPGQEAQAFDICPIVPGDPETSYIIEKISPNPRTGARMPLLGTPLSEGEIGLIAKWIAEGAQDN